MRCPASHLLPAAAGGNTGTALSCQHPALAIKSIIKGRRPVILYPAMVHASGLTIIAAFRDKHLCISHYAPKEFSSLGVRRDPRGLTQGYLGTRIALFVGIIYSTKQGGQDCRAQEHKRAPREKRRAPKGSTLYAYILYFSFIPYLLHVNILSARRGALAGTIS